MNFFPSITATLRRWVGIIFVICLFGVFLQQAFARNKKPKNPQPEQIQPAKQEKKTAPAAETKKEVEPKKAAAPPEGKPKPNGEPAPAPKAKPGSPAVPGGGLAGHEKRGGHLIARHTAKTPEELVSRLRSDMGIASASSFTSLAVAEAVVGVAIGARQKQISAWLRGREDRTTIDFTANKPVGIVVRRRTMTATPATTLRLVLERDPNFQPQGWRIITGYPQS